jgi:hypothetical protein
LACTATYVSTTDKDKLEASITVRNTGSATSHGWTVTWTWPSGEQKIKSFTNALVVQNGKAVTANNTLTNGSGPPGASTTFTIKGSGKAATPVLTCTQH